MGFRTGAAKRRGTKAEGVGMQKRGTFKELVRQWTPSKPLVWDKEFRRAPSVAGERRRAVRLRKEKDDG